MKNILTVDEIKTQLGINPTETKYDGLLQSWDDQLTTDLEERLKQVIVPRVVEDLLCGSGEPKIELLSGRIIEIDGDDNAAKLANVQIRSTALSPWQDIAEDIAYFWIDRTSRWFLRMLDYRIFPVGWQNIRVKYNAGFDPIPGDLMKMALEMIQVRWTESKQGGDLLGKVSKNISEGGQSFNVGLKDMMAVWQPTIDRYARNGNG